MPDPDDGRGLSLRELVIEVRDEVRLVRAEQQLTRSQLAAHESRQVHPGAVSRKELYATIVGSAGVALGILSRIDI